MTPLERRREAARRAVAWAQPSADHAERFAAAIASCLCRRRCGHTAKLESIVDGVAGAAAAAVIAALADEDIPAACANVVRAVIEVEPALVDLIVEDMTDGAMPSPLDHAYPSLRTLLQPLVGDRVSLDACRCYDGLLERDARVGRWCEHLVAIGRELIGCEDPMRAAALRAAIDALRGLGAAAASQVALELEPAREAAFGRIAAWRTIARAAAPPPVPRRELRGHAAHVRALCVVGRTLVTGSEDTTLRFWDLADGSQQAVLDCHDGAINCVAVMPDGKRVVTASDDRTLCVIDLATREVLVRMHGHEGYVSRVAAIDDHRVIATSADATVRVWHAASGQELARLAGHGQWVHALAVSADRKRAATASTDHVVLVWNLDRMRLEHTLVDARAGYRGSVRGMPSIIMDAPNRTGRGHASFPRGLAFAPDGKTLVSIERGVIVWDVETGEPRAEFPDGRFLEAVAVAPDGGAIAVGAGGITLLDPSTGAALASLPCTSNATSLAYAGQRLISGHESGEVVCWELGATGVPATEVGARHGASVSSTTITRDGRTGATGGNDGSVILWDLATARPRHAWSPHKGIATCRFSPDGRRLVTAASVGECKVWDVATAALVRDVPVSKQFWLSDVVFAADGKTAIASSVSDPLLAFELDGDAPPIRFDGPKHVTAIACTADGSHALTAAYSDPTHVVLHWWDLERRTAVWTQSQADYVGAVALAPDAEHGLVGRRGHVLVVRRSDGGLVRSFQAHEQIVSRIWTRPDGAVATLSLSEARVRVHDLAGGSSRSLATIPFTLHHAVVLADRDELYASTPDEVIVWDLAANRPLARMPLPARGYQLAVSPDGATILVGDKAGDVHVFAR